MNAHITGFLITLLASGGEGLADSALAEPSGAGNDVWVRYPQTADFVSNVFAHRGGVT